MATRVAPSEIAKTAWIALLFTVAAIFVAMIAAEGRERAAPVMLHSEVASADIPVVAEPIVSATVEPASLPPVENAAPAATTGGGLRSQLAAAPATPTVPNASQAASATAQASEPGDAASATTTEQTTTETGSAEQATAAKPLETARVPCGATSCDPGLVCCNESCGICARPGESCMKSVCGMSPWVTSEVCGPNTCNVGDLCCNPSCGVCVHPGQTCDSTPCAGGPDIPFSVTCGMSTCNVGLVCCNASCAICARPGEPCRTDPC